VQPVARSKLAKINRVRIWRVEIVLSFLSSLSLALNAAKDTDQGQRYAILGGPFHADQSLDSLFLMAESYETFPN
jgi:hypothetical protein